MKTKLILFLAIFGFTAIGFAAEKKPDIICEVTLVEMSRAYFNEWKKATDDAKMAAEIENRDPQGICFASTISGEKIIVLLKKWREEKQGCQVWTFPPFKTISGEACKIEATREAKYPTEYDKGPPLKPTAWDIKPVGIRCEILPTLGADDETVDITLEWQDVTFRGFIKYEEGAEQPIFSTRKVKTNVSTWDGQTVALAYWLPAPSDTVKIDEIKDSDSEQQRIRIVLITSRLAK